MLANPNHRMGERGIKWNEGKKTSHLETDWGDSKKYPMLRLLGCIDPEPFVDEEAIENRYMIRCRVTGDCFSESEASGLCWVPNPDELIERRNAVRDSWSEPEAHEASRASTAGERAEQRGWTPPQVPRSPAGSGRSLSSSRVNTTWDSNYDE